MLIKGGVANPDGRLGFFAGAERDAREGRGDMSPGTDRDGGQRNNDGNNPRRGGAGPNIKPKQKPPGGGDPKMKYTKPPINRFDLAEKNRLEKERVEKARIAQELFEERAKKEKEKKDLSEKGLKLTDKFGNVIKQSSLNRNKVLAMRNLNLMPTGLPGIYGNLISGLTGKVPDWAKDFTEEELMQVATSGPYLSQQKTKADASRFGRGEDLLGRVFEGQSLLDTNKLSQPEYERLFPSNIITDRNGGGGDNDGINSIIKTPITENVKEEEIPFRPNFRLMADGGMTDDAPMYEGGIMDLESSRQMYGLGKLVKKITRSVKKVAKSPLGKAALLGAAGFGIPGTKFGGLFGTAAKKGLLGKYGLGQTLGMLGKSPQFLGGKTPGFSGFLDRFPGGKFGAGIIGTSIFSGLMTPTEEDQELYAGADLPNPVDYYLGGNYRVNPRLAADGGIMRNGYAEGSEEPVAKKTMPLLDMDGQEMDLREEGGFVPLGRMERADDVPARLSKNEFVFTADAVRNAGEGDIDKGAEVMYNMMKNLESGGEVSEESQGLEGAREMFKTSQRLEEVI